MKKLISLLLLVAMILSITGCNGDTDDTTNTDNATDTTADSSSDSNASDTTQDNSDTEIYNMVMEIVNYGYDDQDIQMVEDEVNKITESAIGVHVSFLTVPIFNMATKLELMVAGGEQIDLVHTGLLTTPNNLAAEGLLTPLNDYLSENSIEMAGDLLKALTIDDQIYAYPGSLYPGTTISFLYDKDLAEQYGIDMPERFNSLEEVLAVFEQVKASGMEQYATSSGDGVNMEWVLGADYDNLGDLAFNSYGVVMGDGPADTVVNWYETETYKAQCDFRRKIYEEGYAVPDSISNGYTVIDSMGQGTIFGFFTSIGTGSSASYWGAQTGKNLESVPLTDVKIDASGVAIISYGIAATSENPQKVADFIELLYTNTELANLLSYGIEDTHYVTQEGSSIIKYPEGMDPMTVGYGSFIGPYGDASKIYFREPLTDEFVATVPDYGVEKAELSQYMGYVFNTSNVQTELTAVQSVIAQYGPSLACGVVEVDSTIADFLEALKAAGIDKVVAENQAQLDAWRAAQ